MNDACHSSMSHAIHDWVMSHLWMSHVTYESHTSMGHVTYEWVILHISLRVCDVRIRHDSFISDTTHSCVRVIRGLSYATWCNEMQHTKLSAIWALSYVKQLIHEWPDSFMCDMHAWCNTRKSEAYEGYEAGLSRHTHLYMIRLFLQMEAHIQHQIRLSEPSKICIYMSATWGHAHHKEL